MSRYEYLELACFKNSGQPDISLSNNKSYKLIMTIDAGAKSNLKPELLLNSMAKYFEAEFKDIKVERKEIYFN